MYDFLLVLYSNIVIKTQRFWDIWLQKCSDHENMVRSLIKSPFDRAHNDFPLKMSPSGREGCDRDFLLMFYSNYGSISCRFWDIQCRKISRPWNPSQEPIKVTESGTIRQTGYSFLLVFYSNFVPLRYSTSKMPWPWKLGYGSVKVIENVIIR